MTRERRADTMGAGSMARLIARTIVLLFFALPAFAQQPAPLAAPNVEIAATSSGSSVIRLPDGRSIVAGNFTSVFDPGSSLPFERTSVARFQANGNLDLAWGVNLAIDGAVSAVAAAPDGSVYIGGSFRNVAGTTRNYLARLTPSGTLDAAWNPNPNGAVYALAVASDGAVYVTGDFSQIGGQSRQYLAKLSGSSGAADATWAPSAFAPFGLALDGAGNLFVGGQQTECVLKLSTTGTGARDPAWNTTQCTGYLTSFSLDGAGSLFIGGGISEVNGVPRRNAAKLAATGAGQLDPSWAPEPDEIVRAVASEVGGTVLLGGPFRNIAGAQRGYLARVTGSGVGTLDAGFAPVLDGDVTSISAGVATTLLGGTFSVTGTRIAGGFARLATANGSAATDQLLSRPGTVRTIRRDASGYAYVLGDFKFARQGGALYRRERVMRLEPGGALDATWSPPFIVDSARAVAADNAGSIFIGGQFFVGGEYRSVVKVAASGVGAPDLTWRPNIVGITTSISDLAMANNGTLFVGGSFFSTGGGISRNGFARVSTSGTGAFDAWHLELSGSVTSLSIDPLDPTVLFVGGSFSSIGGVPRSNLAKVSTVTSSVDPSWAPQTNGIVSRLEADGSAVFVIGAFSIINSSSRIYLAKLSSSGSGAVDAWNPNLFPYLSPLRTLRRDGAYLYLGGDFTQVNGQPIPALARIDASTAVADAFWKPAPNGVVWTLERGIAAGSILVGGAFGTVGGQSRSTVAALPVLVDGVFANGFE